MTGILLALLLFRAYVPVGYMPAAGMPFLVELCPAAGAMPMSMDMRMDMSKPMDMSLSGHIHHHSGIHGHFDNCPFGSASAGGPLSELLAWASAGPVSPPPLAPIQPLPPREPSQRAHQPRGPPLSA